MEGATRKLSPAVYVLALICFFLPFVSFSCQGQRIARFSGIQLVAGTTIQEPQMFGPPRPHKVDAEPLATLAFLCVLVGLGLSFLKGKKGAIGSGVLGLFGVIFLSAMKSKVESDALRQGGGMVQVEFGLGFYLTAIFLLAAIGTSVFALLQGKGIRLPALKASSDKFCTQCGSRNAASDLFCKECGAKFV